MERACATLFLLLEAPVTAFAGVFAIVAPLPFIFAILPPHLTHTALTSPVPDHGTDLHQQALSFATQIYGLLLVLLGLAEVLLFMFRGEVRSKRALLWAMLLADILHVGIFCQTWFGDTSGSPTPLLQRLHAARASAASWGDREWVAFATNIPLVGLFMLLRLTYFATAREQREGTQRSKGGKQV